MATINGQDITATWQMILLKDSLGSLLKYPKRKNVNYTNFAENNGINPDLRKFETESKQVTLKFFMKADSEPEFRTKYNSFFAVINSTDYLILDFGLGITHKVRYDKTTSYSAPKILYKNTDKTGEFTMNFIEDENPVNKSVISPSGGIPLKGVYKINGVDFGDFGIHPDGNTGEALKYADVKEPFDDGREKYLGVRNLKHKETSIPLWFIADTKAQFINNYQAFWNSFAKTGLQLLYVKEIDREIDVYYTNCNNYSVSFGQKYCARFSLSFVIPKVTWL
ncbi:MAG: hypothetical protein LBJ60_02995 [Tannerellaceae bacterium]|jgi:hypothetical protein|nr:hypothetical protein [Tannerellaceae bacterium]